MYVKTGPLLSVFIVHMYVCSMNGYVYGAMNRDWEFKLEAHTSHHMPVESLGILLRSKQLDAIVCEG